MLLTGASFIYVLGPEVLGIEKKPSAKISKLLKQDLQKLRAKNQLPTAWYQIGEIRIKSLSPVASYWLRDFSLPIPITFRGKYILEMEVDHYQEEGAQSAVIFHFHLLEAQSKNSIWEFGRTYPMPLPAQSAKSLAK